MKKIVLLMVLGFLVISACLLYLVKTGVVMRPSPQIKPTVISADFHNVPYSLFLRMFPDLQESHYLLWGIHYESPEVQKTIQGMKEFYEKDFAVPVQMLFFGPDLNPETVRQCKSPCWIFLPEDGAHELDRNEFIDKYIKPFSESYTTLTWINFDQPREVPAECIDQKFLHLNCLKAVSLRDVQKKLKDPRERYFFMRKYLDHDFFLFVQTPRTI